MKGQFEPHITSTAINNPLSDMGLSLEKSLGLLYHASNTHCMEIDIK